MAKRLLTTECIEEIESRLEHDLLVLLSPLVRHHYIFAFHYFPWMDREMHDWIAAQICGKSTGPADYTPLIEQRATFLMFVLCSEGVWK